MDAATADGFLIGVPSSSVEPKHAPMKMVALQGAIIKELDSPWKLRVSTVLRPFNCHLKLSTDQTDELFDSFPKFLQSSDMFHELSGSTGSLQVDIRP